MTTEDVREVVDSSDNQEGIVSDNDATTSHIVSTCPDAANTDDAVTMVDTTDSSTVVPKRRPVFGLDNV